MTRRARGGGETFQWSGDEHWTVDGAGRLFRLCGWGEPISEENFEHFSSSAAVASSLAAHAKQLACVKHTQCCMLHA